MTKTTIYKCHNCPKQTTTLKGMVEHRNAECDIENKNKYVNINLFLKSNKTNICNYYCGFRGKNVKEHRMLCHGVTNKRYYCHLCKYRFKGLLLLKQHLNNHLVDAIVIDIQEPKKEIMLFGKIITLD